MEIQKVTSAIYKHTAYTQRPSEGQRYIVRKNFNQLIPKILKDAQEFQNTTEMKLKATQQLKYVCLIGEDAVQEHLDSIFRAMGKILRNDENAYLQEISATSNIIGCFIPCEVYLPIIMKISSEDELKTQPRLLSSYLLMISNLIQNESDELMSSNLSQLVNFLLFIESQIGDNYEVMQSILEIVVELVRVCHQNIPIYARQLFSLVLSVQAFNVENTQEKIELTLNKLASTCGYSSLSELHTNEVNVMVDEMVQNKSYENWKRGGRDFNKFQAIVRGCKEGIAKFMEQIIEIMKHCLSTNQEIELRMETLILLEYILKLEGMNSVLKLYSTQIMINLIVPCLIWKVGKPLIKIRKAGIINAIILLENKLISSQELNDCLSSIIPPLKNCLTDDWAADLRFASCKFLTYIISSIQDIISEESCRDIYPSLLERLDDSQDPIRIEICESIKLFLKCKNASHSSLEYLLKSIVIHLDDQNENLQRQIFECLQIGAQRLPKIVLHECENSVKKFKYPKKCEELIKYANEQLSKQE